MQKSRKVGLLILLLAIPIFFVLFFEFFSTSHYAVPVFYENGIDSLAACDPSQTVHEVNSLSAHNVVNQDTHRLEFTDAIQIVYPVPEVCEGNCITILEELARVQGVLESQVATHTVLIGKSGDSALRSLSEKYRSGQPNWLFLEGTEDHYPSFLQCELVLPQADIPLYETLTLIDSQGRIRGYYRATDTSEVDRLIAEIRILKYGTNTNEDYAKDRNG